MMRLLYGTTTELVVTITERFFGGQYRLYFAEQFNASPSNPPSSNPFRLFIDYDEIFKTNDLKNPKFIAHQRGVRQAIRVRLNTPDSRREAFATLRALGIHGVRPYLAILEVDTYLQNHYAGYRMELESLRRSPQAAGSPTAIEYVFDNIRGPRLPNAELHLQKLHG
jgi:hypothetical protein